MKLSTLMKRGLAVGLVGAMAVGLVACGDKKDDANQSSANSDKAAASDVTLKFQQWWGVELPEGYLEDICAQFKEDTGITVELLSAPWANTKEQIVSGAANKTVADIVSVDGAWLSEFTDMGILTDLTAAGVDANLATDTWKVGDTSYVVPVLNFAYPMYVNMDILEEAGVKEIPKTWSEMIEACKKIKAAGKSAFALNLGTENPNGIQNVYMGTGWASGMALKDDSGAYKVEGSEDLVSLAEFFKTLNDNGCLYPGANTLEEAAMTSNFAAGNCAFTLASAATMGTFKDVNFQATTVPVKDGYEGKSGICYASWAVGISENCENKEAAAKFVNYLLGGKDGKDGSVSAGLAQTQSAFPNSTVAQPDYSSAPQQFQDFYELYKENYVINEFIGLPNATDVMTNMTNDVVKYLDGSLDADAMLKNWQGYLDEATK
ncbi:Probable ABC transporter-binding protein DR_1438 precursor [uncultured Roseburia sp.]|uniref:Extracellular solute-binding protein n=1 Tax=Brotonthovivens ammoniilytica TaxID=2981725 RepID=A0ABT2TNJ5_9FIRM|nr:extracellular solute-binding protein [Brotonthovivens ammoniilytica]MCU6763790.1 extracellular solute-binding protein [Brotonthovivens ammoniilytica]SCJ35464.1 Probable ABC transporter-binding protein DR_1438 precursor [uncultured Roseburia sp.]